MSMKVYSVCVTARMMSSSLLQSRMAHIEAASPTEAEAIGRSQVMEAFPEINLIIEVNASDPVTPLTPKSFRQVYEEGIAFRNKPEVKEVLAKHSRTPSP